MRVLLTATALERFGDRLPSDVEYVAMTADGSLADGTPWEQADVEVAWPTSDLFEPRAPLRPFFAFLIQSTTLRWIQSPAAGVDAPVFAQLVRKGIRLTTSHVTDIPISEFVLRSVLDHYQRPQEWAASSVAREWASPRVPRGARHDVARGRARQHRCRHGRSGPRLRGRRHRGTTQPTGGRAGRPDDPARRGAGPPRRGGRRRAGRTGDGRDPPSGRRGDFSPP